MLLVGFVAGALAALVAIVAWQILFEMNNCA